MVAEAALGAGLASLPTLHGATAVIRGATRAHATATKLADVATDRCVLESRVHHAQPVGWWMAPEKAAGAAVGAVHLRCIIAPIPSPRTLIRRADVLISLLEAA